MRQHKQTEPLFQVVQDNSLANSIRHRMAFYYLGLESAIFRYLETYGE